MNPKVVRLAESLVGAKGDQMNTITNELPRPGARVALYARVSTKDQNCEMQLADLRRMAEARKVEIVKAYIDHGVSGASESRPALDELMQDARRGHFDAVWCWRFDRFARSLRHLVTALEEFQALGIGWISHQENIDTTTPSGRVLFAVIGAMAEFERDIARERINAGLRRARERGVQLGRRRVEIDVEEAKRLRAEGLSFREVAKRLKVSVGKVHAALRDPKIAGMRVSPCEH